MGMLGSRERGYVKIDLEAYSWKSESLQGNNRLIW